MIRQPVPFFLPSGSSVRKWGLDPARHLPGYKVERVLPFTGMHHTMYSVEFKNSEGELPSFHINPFSYIMPFSGPWGRGS